MKFSLILFSLFVLTGLCMADYAVVATIDAPDTNISGLGFGNGALWAVDGVTEYAYKLDPATGTVELNWYLAENTTKVPSGLTFANNTVYIACGVSPNLTSSYCFKYDDQGVYQASFSLDC